MNLTDLLKAIGKKTTLGLNITKVRAALSINSFWKCLDKFMGLSQVVMEFRYARRTSVGASSEPGLVLNHLSHL